jgi:hypothetical protein
MQMSLSQGMLSFELIPQLLHPRYSPLQRLQLASLLLPFEPRRLRDRQLQLRH